MLAFTEKRGTMRLANLVLVCCILFSVSCKIFAGENMQSRIVRIPNLDEKELPEKLAKDFQWIGLNKTTSLTYANGILGTLSSVGSMPMEIQSKDKKRYACFAGAGTKDVEYSLRFARALAPSVNRKQVINFIVEHEAAHCSGVGDKQGLAALDDPKYKTIEEARADAAAFLFLEHQPGFRQQEFLSFLRAKRIFDALRSDTTHGAYFLTIKLIKDRDASVSHAIMAASQFEAFDFDSLSDIFMSLHDAIGVGEDGSPEQACAWEEAMSKAPGYIQPFLFTLEETRSIGKLAYAGSDNWRKEAVSTRTGVSPEKARFPGCAAPRH